MTNQSERVILQNQMVFILSFFIFVRSFEAGVGYQTGDEVVIEPSYGITVVMEGRQCGRVSKVKDTQEERVSEIFH